jgi:hypothetical protein
LKAEYIEPAAKLNLNLGFPVNFKSAAAGPANWRAGLSALETKRKGAKMPSRREWWQRPGTGALRRSFWETMNERLELPVRKTNPWPL